MTVENDSGGRRGLAPGTLAAAVIAVCVAEISLAIPAVLNGVFQNDLGPTSAQLTWISDAFLVPVTLFELTFGVLGDLFGRKRLLIGGALLVVVGEVIGILTPGLGTSTSTRVLIIWISQAVSGIGAAAMFPTSLAMVAAGTHTARHRARSLTLWAAALSGGNMLSPVLGGWLGGFSWGNDPNASWRWSFVAVVILAAFSAVFSLLFAQDSSAPEGRSLDWAGQVTIAIALFGLMFAIIQGPTSGWGSAEVIVGFAVAAVFGVLFVLAENRSAAPLLRMDLFKIRPFTIATIAALIGMFGFLSTGYTTSIRIGSIQGFSPLTVAIAFLLFNGIALVLMPLTSTLLERYNPRWTLGAGLALMASGSLWASTVPVSDMDVGSVLPCYALVGIGFALAVSSVTAVLVNTVPNHLAGMVSGEASMVRDFGFSLGPAVVGAIALTQAASSIHSRVASSPALSKALAAFNAANSGATATASQKAAVGAVNSGPLGANAVPSTITVNGHTVAFNPLKDVAFHALGAGYNNGYLVSGLASLVAALLVVTALGGKGTRDTLITDASLSDETGR